MLQSGLMLHVTLASRTATLACPDAVGAVRSLQASDLERYRAPLEACARSLYSVRSDGRALEPLDARVRLTEEGDFDARLLYARAAPGELTLEAAHLKRLPDPMFGAELTVTSEHDFLGQALLRATSPALTVHVPAAAGTASPAAARPAWFGTGWRIGLAVVAGGALLWLLRRRA